MPLGRSFETASASLLLNKLVTQDVIDYLIKWKIDSSLFQKLNLALLHINAILNHAEEKQFSDPDVKAWLEEVKDVRYDAEDIIDEIATGVLESRNSPSKVRNFLYDSVNASDSVKEGIDFKMKDIAAAINPFKQRLESRMNGIVGRLEDIVRHKDILNLKEDVGVKWSEITGRTPTTPMFDESFVYGRDSDKEKIMKLLQSEQGDKVHVIPIVGLGGIGKTTLARIVYSEKIVKDPFTLKAWACVSDEFDVKRITRTLVESITRATCKITNLDLLQEKLKILLEGKKFLLVLDDVWNEIYENWDNLKILFTRGAPGSRIVVTTRSEKVASIMGTLPTHYLKELSKEDCISLFEQIVFPNGNSDAYPMLKDIGEKRVSRCGGLPLAVKALGGLLRFEFDASQWESILHSKMWKLPDNTILPALSLSYHHLPVHLKRCFAYCSMFPKDFEFGKDRLVLLWMAEGFIQQPPENESMEDVGHKYFSALVSRSLFQLVGGDKSRFVMHDLIHDLAQSVSGKTCLRFEGKMDIGNGNKYNVPVKTRHFSYTRGFNDSFQKFEPLSKVDCLRTFLPLDPLLGFHWSSLSNKVLSELLLKFKLLRVLSFSGYEIVKLPDFLADLKHLRFLDLSYSQIKELPESTNSLYNLQTLILVNCDSLRTLPTDVGSLTNLRHLDIHGTSLEKMPLRMGTLTNLQFLSNFVVGTGNSSGIRELENLSNLHGTLTISGLHNVTNIKDAIQAKLETKKNLDELFLEWISINDSRDEAVETEVFDVLQPHESLKKLTIKYYGGIEFPSWMGDPSFTNMVCLHLYGCKNCTLLPPLGQLLSLKDLSIGGMDGVKHVGAEFLGDADLSIKPFPVLEILNFEDMKQWEEWYFENGVEGFPYLRQLSILRCPVLKKFSHRFPSLEKLKVQKCVALESFTSLSRHENMEYEEFPCLRWLIIGGCTKLIELPNSLPSLEALEIDDCLELAAFPRLVNLQKLELLDSNAKLLGSMVDFSSLTSLHIRQISFVKCLPACMIKQFGKLENLKIVGCDDFEGLSNEQGVTEDLASLQHLTISHCPKLVALPDEDIKLLPKLKLLDLSHCHNLIKLPCELQKVKSLLELKIDWCPKLEWFPEQELPARLQRLIIRDCGALKTLPKKMLQNNTALEYLEIHRCSSLTSVLEQGDLPTTLKLFRIYHCKNLVSLPGGIMCKEKLSLERLEIDNCFSLSSFPAGEFPTALKRLEISECAKLKSLPASLLNLVNLDSLEISGCNTLKYFPTGGLPSNLRSVTISQCEKLESLPERIHMLKFLQELVISYCSSLKSLPRQGLPKSLISLTIRDCEKLNPIHEWKLHKLTSLETFNIGGVPDLVFFPDEYPLPYSIKYFGITNMPDLESLSEVLKNLSSLETLLIRGCKKLYSLAENGIPSSLADLTIRQCPLLKRRCEQDKGDMWPKLECIPCIELSE